MERKVFLRVKLGSGFRKGPALMLSDRRSGVGCQGRAGVSRDFVDRWLADRLEAWRRGLSAQGALELVGRHGQS
jgi:hypothetical protein